MRRFATAREVRRVEAMLSSGYPMTLGEMAHNGRMRKVHVESAIRALQYRKGAPQYQGPFTTLAELKEATK